MKFTGVERNTAGFGLTMRPEAAALLAEGAREQVWRSLEPFRHLPTWGEQKILHMHNNLGRRMQASVDIHKFFFHDLIPFVDEDLFDFWLRIPLEQKYENAIYLELYRTRMTELAKVPWSRTGFDLFASEEPIRRELARRERFRRTSALVRKFSRGRLNPRDRTTYNDRPAWVRRNRVFHDEFHGVLADVGATGCDWFDQAKVDALRAELNRGKDWHFHTLAQVYTAVVWHGQFLRDAPAGADLVPLEEG
jgi:hypothetical protein